ncbi:aminopeptidase I zinc metalloprotease-domain-containing protein, partial [Jimgerdemannia flammicorona]
MPSPASKIKDLELCLYDTQGSVIGGARNQFIFSPHLDNLEISVTALINTSNDLASEPNICLIALFDNEAVGSNTAYGADSNLLPATLWQLTATHTGNATPSATTFEEPLHKSYLISTDMAYAMHPNCRWVGFCAISGGIQNGGGFAWLDHSAESSIFLFVLFPSSGKYQEKRCIVKINANQSTLKTKFIKLYYN